MMPAMLLSWLFGILLVCLLCQVPQVDATALPAVSAGEQYRYTLGKALKNELEVAEPAFQEFLDINGVHARIPDVLFWLGRVQFIQRKWE